MRLLGILDLTSAPSFLGCGLMLLEELSAVKSAKGYDAVDLAVITDVSGFASASVLDALLGIRDVEDHFVCTDRQGAVELVARLDATHAVYPTSDLAVLTTWDYDSSSRLQAHFLEYGSLPVLGMKASPARWAETFVAAQGKAGKVVAVHLKNTGGPESESNANFDHWHDFFSSISDTTPVRFVLIGNEPIPDRISELSNVTLSRDVGAGLIEDLALIQSADGFMGTVSGPFNMALFGEKPYVAFKHPSHHADAMMAELGNRTAYPFAVAGQRILRVRPDVAVLRDAFDGLLADIHDAAA